MSDKFQKLCPALHWVGWSKNIFSEENIHLPYGCDVCPFAAEVIDPGRYSVRDDYACGLNDNKIATNGNPICNIEQWRSRIRKEVEEIANYNIQNAIKEDAIANAFKDKSKEIAALIEGVSESDIKMFLNKIIAE